MKKLFLIISFLIISAGTAQSETLRINPYLSQATFTLKHAVGFNSGFVREFAGTIDVDKEKRLIKKSFLSLI